MALETYCANLACRRRFVFPNTSAGKSVRCQSCGQTFIAGASATVAGAAPPRPAKDTPGSTLGRFIVREKLGAGAFGVVYRVFDPILDRDVALKVPNAAVMSDEKRIERFLREAKAAAGLRHPHIVAVLDAGKDGDRCYIASAFIEGKPLDDAISQGGTDFPRAARLVQELAEALAYAHQQGVVHRDVKPANIMVDAKLVGHPNVIQAAFSPDGTRIATVSRELTCVWDAKGGGLVLLTLKNIHPATAVAWSRDGSRLVTVGSAGFVVHGDRGLSR